METIGKPYGKPWGNQCSHHPLGHGNSEMKPGVHPKPREMNGTLSSGLEYVRKL